MWRARPARRPVLSAVVAAVVVLVPLLRPSPVPAATSASGPDTWNAKVVPFPANDVEYETWRGAVLATVPSTHLSLGNELVELDPNTGAVGRHVFVGSEPDLLAVTDDGATAYVSLKGSLRIARVDLSTFTLLSSFSSDGGPTSRPEPVEDLETVPGDDGVVVVSLGDGYNDYGVVLYREGTALPATLSHSTIANRVEVASSTTAYGYNSHSSGFELSTLAIDGTGLHMVETGKTALEGYVDVKLAGGLLYGANGTVIDPVSRQRVGAYASGGLIEVTAADGRATFLDTWSAGADARTTFSVFDTTSHALVGTRTFEGLTAEPLSTSGSEGPLYRSHLEATGTGFAVSTNRGVVLVGPSVGGASAPLPLGPPSSIDMLQATVVELQTADILSDPERHVVYASAPSTWTGHRLVAIDPISGQVVRSLVVAAEPKDLALSDDGSRLYLSTWDFVGSARIVQIDPATFTVLGSFTVGTPEERFRVRDIKVMPGTADTLAVSVAGDNPAGVALFDDGVRRPNMTPSPFAPERIAFRDASTLYGFNSYGDLLMIAVEPAGLTLSSVEHDLGPGSPAKLAGGLLFGDGGAMVDPEKGERLGRLAGDGPIEPQPWRNRAFIYEEYHSTSLYEFDLAHQRRIAGRPFSGLGYAQQLIGTSAGFAARLEGAATGDKLLLLHPPGVPTVSRLLDSTGTNQGGNNMAIYGSGFSGATSVSFGSTPAVSFTVVSGEEIGAVVPPHAPGTVKISVSTPTGTNADLPAASFTYTAIEPHLYGLNPARGPSTGGTSIVVSGDYLLGAQSVTFGGIPALSFTPVSSTQISAITPPSVAGAVPIVVTTSGGTTAGSYSPQFTYSSDPPTPITTTTTTTAPPPATPRSIAPLMPTRLLETRGAGQLGYSGAKPLAGQVVQLVVAGRGGVPASGAGLVVLNVTATEAAGGGFVTVWPCGSPRPTASTLNLERVNQTVANAAVVGVGTGGAVCLSSTVSTHLIADVTAWSTA